MPHISPLIPFNLIAAVLVPLIIPLVPPHPDLTFGNTFALILEKVFPFLLCPFIAAVLIRYLLPKFHALLARYHELAFYMWAVALSLSVTVKILYIVKSIFSTNWNWLAFL